MLKSDQVSLDTDQVRGSLSVPANLGSYARPSRQTAAPVLGHPGPPRCRPGEALHPSPPRATSVTVGLVAPSFWVDNRGPLVPLVPLLSSKNTAAGAEACNPRVHTLPALLEVSLRGVSHSKHRQLSEADVATVPGPLRMPATVGGARGSQRAVIGPPPPLSFPSNCQKLRCASHLLVTYGRRANDRKRNGLQQHPFNVSQFLGVRNPGTAGLGALPRVSPGRRVAATLRSHGEVPPREKLPLSSARWPSAHFPWLCE